MPRRSLLLTAVTVVGGLVAATGLVVLLRRPPGSEIGWFAYAPVAEPELDGLVVLAGRQAGGAVLLALGLLLVALVLGTRAGRGGARATSRRSVALLGGLVVLTGVVGLARPRTLVVVDTDLTFVAPADPTLLCLAPDQVVALGVVLVGVLLLAGVVGARAAARRDV